MSDTDTRPSELEAEIEAQRAQLAETVDQLSHKLDVKAQAKARLDRVAPMSRWRSRSASLLAVSALVLVAAAAPMSQSTQGLDRTEPTTPDPDDPASPTSRPTSRSGRGGTSREGLARVHATTSAPTWPRR